MKLTTHLKQFLDKPGFLSTAKEVNDEIYNLESQLSSLEILRSGRDRAFKELRAINQDIKTIIVRIALLKDFKAARAF